MSTGKDLSEAAVKELARSIADFSDQSQSQKFCELVGQAIKADRELCGQFPFLFYRLRSYSDPVLEPKGLAITKCAEGAAEFCSSFFSEWKGAAPEITTASLKELFSRTNETMDDRRLYGALLVFFLALGLRDVPRFLGGHVFDALPRFKAIISRSVLHLQSGEAAWETLRKHVESELVADKSRQFVQRSLGGMLELGSVKQDTLWRSIFQRDAPTDSEVDGMDSLHRYYVGYRYSSVVPKGVLSKTFVVLQSPGNATGKFRGFREHFAIKAFTQTLTNRIHVSAGALVSLGSKVACFGSRRWLEDEDNWEKERQFSGAKSLFLNRQCFDDGGDFLTGHVLVTNSANETISANMIFVESKHQHSDDANIGPIPIGGLADDFLESTIFGSAEDLDDGAKAKLTTTLLEKMAICAPKAFSGEITSEKAPIVSGHDSCAGEVTWKLSELGITTEFS
ncbi:MAG: hypothetical protein AB8B94_08485 [Hyphomicrobiales bacterium]